MRGLGHRPAGRARQTGGLTPSFLHGCLVLALLSLSACGVSSATYSHTLQELDEVKRQLAQAAPDGERAARLQSALDAQRQSNEQLRTRLIELEELTANQNISAEARSQQLRTVTAEREELLLEIAELKRQLSEGRVPGPSSTPVLHSCEAIRAAQGARELPDLGVMKEVAHVESAESPSRALVQLPEPFLFEDSQAVLTTAGAYALCWLFDGLGPKAVRRVEVTTVADTRRDGSSERLAEGTEASTAWALAAARAAAVAGHFDLNGGLSADVHIIGAASANDPAAVGRVGLVVFWSDGKPAPPHPLLGASSSNNP